MLNMVEEAAQHIVLCLIVWTSVALTLVTPVYKYTPVSYTTSYTASNSGIKTAVADKPTPDPIPAVVADYEERESDDVRYHPRL